MSKRNEQKQQTCYALDACTQDQVIDIFEETFGYLSFTETYVDRIKAEPIDYNTDTIAASSRPLVILDIDNTLLYCRYFADEICVRDNISFCHNGADQTDGIVTSVWYRINLQLFDDDIIDAYGTDLIEYDHCHTTPHRLKKKKTFNYPYKIDEKTNQILESREGLIKKLTVIGCEIEYEMFSKTNHKFISFEEDSNEIEHFVPSLTRKGYDDAAFIYDGFLVRLRYGLEDFIEGIDASFDVVLYTAACRSVYEGLTVKLHQYLCECLGLNANEKYLWRRVLFRDDCDYDFDSNGKLFHHKDITKFNKDLSKVIIIDNTALAFKQFEPNAILIADYMGKNKMDNELDVVLSKLDDIIDREHDEADKYIDYRYILCGIEEIPSDLDQYDRTSPRDILESTQRFLNDLKDSLIQREVLPNTLTFCDAVLPEETKDDVEAAVSPKAKMKRQHTYTISIRLQDIPHFDIQNEMHINSLTHTDEPHLLSELDANDDDEDEDTEDEEEEDECPTPSEVIITPPTPSDQEEKEVPRMPSLRKRTTVANTMRARTGNALMLRDTGHSFIKRQRSQRILNFFQYKQNDKKLNELKKKYERAVPPAPPKRKAKRIDNPWVAQMKRVGVVNGDNITLGRVMKKVHNKPPPPPPSRRTNAVPPPKPPAKKLGAPPRILRRGSSLDKLENGLD